MALGVRQPPMQNVAGSHAPVKFRRRSGADFAVLWRAGESGAGSQPMMMFFHVTLEDETRLKRARLLVMRR